MVWIGISRERSQIYLWLRPQKRQRKFAIEKASSSKPGALIPVLAPSTPPANSPLKGLALRLAPPPNHCAIPSSQKLQNIHRFVACSPPGSKRSSYPCPLSAHSPCPHRSLQFWSFYWPITSDSMVDFEIYLSVCLSMPDTGALCFWTILIGS